MLTKFEFEMPNWGTGNVNLYYWGDNASCSWPGDAMTLVDGTTHTYCVTVDASVKFEGIIVNFKQNNDVKQSIDITTNLPEEPGEYTITYVDSWSQNSGGTWVFGATISSK